MDWPGETAMPPSLRLPSVVGGTLVMTMPANVLADGLSRASLKPVLKSAAEKVTAVAWVDWFSSIVFWKFAPDGASATGVTLIDIVLGGDEVSTPPLAVPPSSWRRNTMFARLLPF